MSEKIRKALLFLFIYSLILWVGFQSGVSYNRMKNKLAVEKIIVEGQPIPRSYYIIEKFNYANYSQTTFREEFENGLTVKFFLNKNLRPLLKLRNLQIYTSKGERVY